MAKKQAFVVVGLMVALIGLAFVLPSILDSQLMPAVLILMGVGLVVAFRSLGSATQSASAVAVASDAVVLREGLASLKDGWVLVGGVLKLTPDKLVFSAHSLGQKARVHCFELREFRSSAPARSLGLIPNAILVRFGSTEIKLVVTGREEWLGAIRSAATSLHHVAA